MSREGGHPAEELQALLDGRLAGAEREAVERHLKGCDRCRGELAALRWAGERVASLSTLPAPPGLAARVRAALDAEDARTERGGRLPLWLPVAAAAALVLVLSSVPLWLAGAPDLAGEVHADLVGVAAGELPLEAERLSPAELEPWFSREGIPFATRVFDLGAMAFELVGGRVQRTGGGPGALFVYRGPDGALVVCQMFVGTIPPADSGADVHHREDGVAFHTLRRDGAVLVFWQEGEVACAMGSLALPEEQVRALAFAKAIKV